MLTLFVIRHAKSSWANAGQADFDRPLNSRGRGAAPLIGAYMSAHGYAPQLILSSASTRTRQTLALMLPELSGESTIKLEDRLYQAHDGVALMNRLRAISEPVQRVMLIGHNPAIHDLVLLLAKSGDPDAVVQLEKKYPTGALTVLQIPVNAWSALGPEIGVIVDYAAPRELEDQI